MGAKCNRDASAALADAMRQIAPVWDGEGWQARLLHGSPGDASGLTFPLVVGGRLPRVLILPVADAVGPYRYTAVGERHYSTGSAPAFEAALAKASTRQGLTVVHARSEADWILRAAVMRAWQGSRGPLRTRWRLQIEDRSGALLWEGDLDGQGWGKTYPLAMQDLARNGADGFSRALWGQEPARLADSDFSGGEGPSLLGVIGGAAQGIGMLGGTSFTRSASRKVQKTVEALEQAGGVLAPAPAAQPAAAPSPFGEAPR